MTPQEEMFFHNDPWKLLQLELHNVYHVPYIPTYTRMVVLCLSRLDIQQQTFVFLIINDPYIVHVNRIQYIKDLVRWTPWSTLFFPVNQRRSTSRGRIVQYKSICLSYIDQQVFSYQTTESMQRGYSYGNNFNKAPQIANKPSIIYADEDLFAGRSATGWYLFHSTKDPTAQYKQKRIGNLTKKPAKEYILEEIEYGPMGDKIKYKLDKEKLEDWITEEFKYNFSSKPSPWGDKELGVSSKKRTKPAVAAASSTDDDDDEATPPPKKNKTEDIWAPSEEYLGIKRKLDEIFILLQELVTEKRQQPSNLGIPVDGS